MPGDARGYTSGGRQQKVPGSTGGVDHGKIQERSGGIGGLCLCPVQNRIERRVEQELNETVRCVVGPCRLALVASFLGCFRSEGERFTVVAKLWLELQQDS